MHPESGLWMAPNQPSIRKIMCRHNLLTQLQHQIIFDTVVFLLSNLGIDPSSKSISLLVLEL